MRKLLIAIVILGGLFFNARCLEATIISPPVLEIEGRRGEVVQAAIKIRNDDSDVKLYYLSVESFEADGEMGQVKILEDEIDYSLSAWIELPGTQVILQPGEQAEIVFNIKIPDRAEPGGHYATILLADRPSYLDGMKNSSVRVGSKIGILILLKVEGETKEEVKVITLETLNKKRFYWGLPIEYTVRLENTGNVHLKPEGEIVLSNIFGRQVKKVAKIDIYDQNGELVENQELDGLPVNLEGGNVLPGSVRRFETVWTDNNFVFGRYTSELRVNFGEKGSSLSVRGPTIWVIQWRILLTSLVVFLLVAIVFLFLRRAKK